jgi:ferrous iron transport protein A
MKPSPLHDAMSKTNNNLEHLPCGQSACIDGIHVEQELRNRFLALGLKPGRFVQVLRRAGMGGPIHVRVGSTEIMLRRKEASHIQVEPVQALAT